MKDETLARTNFGNIADPGFENADEHQYSLLANSRPSTLRKLFLASTTTMWELHLI